MEFINNAELIKSKEELPQIWSKRKNATCIEISNYFEEDENLNDKYIFFRVRYVEDCSIKIYDDFQVNSCTFCYAIDKNNI